MHEGNNVKIDFENPPGYFCVAPVLILVAQSTQLLHSASIVYPIKEGITTY